jgi:hypothetical protein
MNENRNQPFDQAELEASLARLGIRELAERMEVSPLLVDTGTEGAQANDATVCCTCKIPNPWEGENLPYPTIDPGPTGPTNPNGVF